jgi:hypothetical protein
VRNRIPNRRIEQPRDLTGAQRAIVDRWAQADGFPVWETGIEVIFETCCHGCLSDLDRHYCFVSIVDFFSVF